jgi:Protein of unknown function (DUF3422)
MFMFEELDDYDQLLMGAHRKPATILGTPSLVWHVALWKQIPATASEEERERRAGLLDAYLQDIYKRLAKSSSPVIDSFSIPAQEPHPKATQKADKYELFRKFINESDGKFVEDDSLTKAAANRAVTYQFNWHGLLVRLRFEQHTEYLTISSYIDCSAQIADERLTKLRATDDLFKSVEDNFLLLEKGLKDNAVELATVHNFLYHEIWERFCVSIFETQAIDIADLGKVFADFRGIVVGSNSNKFNASNDGNAPCFQLPFRHSPVAAPIIDETLVKQLWPFLTSETRVDFSKFEFTASAMLKRNALYVTALGAQPSVLPKGPRFPLLYFFHSKAPNHWQLGRLVDRINNLGTVRLAAIMYHDDLIQAGHTLREIEKKISGTITAVHKLASPDKPVQTSESHSEPHAQASQMKEDSTGPLINTVEELSSGQALKNIQGAFTDIQTEMSAVSKTFDNDIGYRIERSRYYVQQFAQGIRDLRIRRIEGYQPYHVFVQRRLGPMFEYITMLGRRLEQVEKDISALFQYYQAQHTTTVAISSEARQTEIERLQALGELVLVGVLVPYYVGSAFEHFVPTGMDRRYFWGLMVALGFILLVARYRKNYPKQWNKHLDALYRSLRLKRIIGVVGAAIVLAAIYLLWSLRYF